MAKLSHRLELTANVLIIVVGLLLAFTLIRNNYFSSPTVISPNGRVNAGPDVGTKISLPPEIFGSHQKTIVLGLDIRCRFCKESADFYKRLASLVGSETQILAYFPSAVEESQNYLAGLGIEGFQARQIKLSELNIRGTPTMILIDREGMVLGSWVGKIPVDKELEIIEKVRGESK